MATVKSLLSLLLNAKPSATTQACSHILSPKLLENWHVSIPSVTRLPIEGITVTELSSGKTRPLLSIKI